MMKPTTESDAQQPVELETVWRCFHCDEVFVDRQAAEDHFGISECDTPACKVSPDLATILRMQEKELYEHRSGQTALGLLYYKFGAEHSTALRKAEEQGYERGLADLQSLLLKVAEAVRDEIAVILDREAERHSAMTNVHIANGANEMAAVRASASLDARLIAGQIREHPVASAIRRVTEEK